MNVQSKTLLEIYRMLESHGCKFIRVLPNSKKPDGTWTNDSDPAWLTAEQAVSRLESKAGNVGVVPRGNVFMIDLDGEDAIERFDNECEGLPDFETFVVQTPNGMHVYFLASEPGLIRVSVGKTYWGEDIDIRAPGATCQVIGPGSYVEASEKDKKAGKVSGPYEIAHDAPIAIAPEKIEALSRKRLKMDKRSSGSTETPPGAGSENAKPTIKTCRNKISEALRTIRQAPVGKRNNTISDYAYVAGSYAVHYPDEFGTVRDRLMEAVDKVLTDDDSEDERAKHHDTAEKQFQFGIDHPHYKESEKGKESNEHEPAEFLNLCDLMGYRARFNLANQSEEWWFESESKWRPMIPHETRSLFVRVWNEHDWNVKAQDRQNLLTFVAGRNRVHPYREELLSYRDYVDPELKDIPIGQSLKYWVVNPEGEFETWCQTAIWVGMVSRIMGDPESQRTHVTLRGPGGCGKSSLVKSLLPDELGGVGQLRVSGSDRDRIVLVKDRYAVEFNEMAGMGAREAAELKAFFGAGEMQIRILRTTESMTVKYDACIIGTSNNDQSLYDDPALIERFAYLDFHPRKPDTPNPADLIPKIRKHYLAEALRMYLEGERYNVIPEGLKPVLMERAAPSVKEDQGLLDRIGSTDYPNTPEWTTALELAQHAGLARDYGEYRRNRLHVTLPPILRRLGFTSHKGARGVEWWQRPANYPRGIPMGTKQTRDRKNAANRAYGRMNLPEMVNPVNIVDFEDL